MTCFHCSVRIPWRQHKKIHVNHSWGRNLWAMNSLVALKEEFMTHTLILCYCMRWDIFHVRVGVGALNLPHACRAHKSGHFGTIQPLVQTDRSSIGHLTLPTYPTHPTHPPYQFSCVSHTWLLALQKSIIFGRLKKLYKCWRSYTSAFRLPQAILPCPLTSIHPPYWFHVFHTRDFLFCRSVTFGGLDKLYKCSYT